MTWLLVLIAQIAFLAAGIRRERRAGLWSNSKFFFALGFAAVECTLLLVPIFTLDQNGRYFLPVFAAAGVIAALNFIWFIVVMRRWRLPDGRTSLEAWQDSQQNSQK
jgi:hypothetical protein